MTNVPDAQYAEASWWLCYRCEHCQADGSRLQRQAVVVHAA